MSVIQVWTDLDQRMMRRAIQISKRGFPAPNPHVGCVLEKNGEVVAEGFHAFAGGPHAEAAALKKAGPQAQGTTAYGTLEPCNHHGRTPPCSEALLRAGVRRVIFAVPDPNPRAAGGLLKLANAGVEVKQGLLKEEAAAANHQFLFSIQNQRPLIVVKAAIGLDGRIALPSGESKWITGEKARNQAHQLRAELGAVLVGRRTVEQDNPELTARIPGVVNQPVRIVLDPKNQLIGMEHVFDARARSIHVTGEIDLAKLTCEWFKSGITGILVEGGANTISSFFRANLVDRIELFIAPKILGEGLSWINDLGINSMSEARQFEFQSVKQLEEDLWITAIPKSLSE
ncbi:bifunctional diaminohydroxyphosphoribosylaminopyrimidine deaminase/5-amino-6-(5-phosphoribosylamino)uracil reductase RibD [soil metagenome]